MKAVVHTDFDTFRSEGGRGAVCFMGQDGLAFKCPCCGTEGYLPFKGPGDTWEWDGNTTAPTVTPSIRYTGGCLWHGWLKAGVFRDA